MQNLYSQAGSLIWYDGIQNQKHNTIYITRMTRKEVKKLPKTTAMQQAHRINNTDWSKRTTNIR